MAFADRKKREREERRNDIIDAAEKHFFDREYDDVSMEDIAREVGINKALLYYYFKDKETLFSAIVLRAARIMTGMMEKNAKGKKTGITKLKAMGRAVFDFSVEYPGYYKVYCYYRTPGFCSSSNEYSPEIGRLSMSTLTRPCQAVKDGIEDGTIREGVNPMEIALFLALVSDGITKMSPKLEKFMESQGITHARFIDDSLDLLEIMLENKASGK